MNKPIETLQRAIRISPLLILLLTWMSLSACKTRVLVIPADQIETFVKKGETITAPENGVYMSDARYQRYRKAVADKITALQTK